MKLPPPCVSAQRHGQFIGCLRIERVGGVGVGGAVGNAVAAGELAAGNHRLHIFRRAEGRRPGLHVDVGGEAAIHHRCPAAHHLGEGDAGQRFGILLHQCARDRHRRHRPRQRKGCDDDNLISSRHFHDALQHRPVEPQRRRGVDDGEERGFLFHLLRCNAAANAGDLQSIEITLLAKRIGVKHLVGQLHHVRQTIEVAHGGMDIDGLDRITAGRVDHVVGLGELDQLAVVFLIAGATAAVAVGDERRACDLGEDQIVAADLDVAYRVAGMQREAGRGRRDHLGDQAAVEAHAVGAGADIGAGCLHQAAGFRQDDIHSDLFEHRQRCLVDRLDGLVIDDFGFLQRIDEIEIFGTAEALAGALGSPAAGSFAALDGCICIGEGRRRRLVVAHGFSIG